MDPSELTFNEKRIVDCLLPFDSPSRTAITDQFFTPSAVLFAIIPYEDNPYELVLIHRTDKGTKHRGEMSFPGGKVDPEDNSRMDTALRECEEEIGVPRDKIKIIGCLHDFPTMTRYIITPFVGLIDKDQKLIKQESEVQDIVKVPIDFFFEKKTFKEQAFDFEGKKFPVFYFYYKDPSGYKHTIWGATAYMIATFIDLVYGVNLSKLRIRRFTTEEIKPLKNYIEMRKQILKKDE